MRPLTKSNAPVKVITPDTFPPCPFCGGAARIEEQAGYYSLTADHKNTCCLFEAGAPLMTRKASGLTYSAMVNGWTNRVEAQ